MSKVSSDERGPDSSQLYIAAVTLGVATVTTSNYRYEGNIKGMSDVMLSSQEKHKGNSILSRVTSE